MSDNSASEVEQLRQRCAALEDELRAVEERLRFFVEHSPAAIAMLDTEMRYILASQRWLTDYGLEGMNIVGRSHYEIFPDLPERWKEIHRRALAGAFEEAEEDPWTREDGSTEWITWKCYPWFKGDGAIGGIVFFTEVVTKRIRERQELEESREQLRATVEEQERLIQAIREMSTPVVPIYDEIIVLPLVGSIDSRRSAQIMEALLSGIQHYAAEIAIIDITGVSVVDTSVANHLIQTTRAASLLGAHCVLVGISAEVAQAMVHLGVDLSTVVTRSNLQAGIEYALDRLGKQITTRVSAPTPDLLVR
ncbi:PAS domain-containing protein [Roseiflexus castenholzii]|uniref:Putative PAS/PAC sensor protein n=1 Tax=Roseiflexus castenholzii (strain DSM 13941 / HLO8) TaxID=383372 RepID=A7NLZ2_ROSCS|nr:PAS domain-containing protein [Roseiflexus castenholzii]ABU58540.1 putative PAS/PAC sensor protein [Roseiflexus castenholzii DSM 13941]